MRRRLDAGIESVELSVGILMAHRLFLRHLDLEADSVAHFSFFVLEAVGKDDPGAMFFASDWIDDRFHARL